MKNDPDKTIEEPTGDRIIRDWDALPVSQRAELLKAGVPFPGETEEERRCRVKARLGLLDDGDLGALTGNGEDALARHRVNGTGPTPTRVMRSVFYFAEDVASWMKNHRDGVRGTAKSGGKAA
jgi:hypothetical protein